MPGKIMQKILSFLILSYQTILSPLLGSHCRYYPSCSHYANISINRFGVIRGGWLALKRVARCHPWHSGGVDEVPVTLHEQTLCKHQHSEAYTEVTISAQSKKKAHG